MTSEQKVRVSPSTIQRNLLKIAKQQQEIQQLKAELGIQRNNAKELAERWELVRKACGALIDSTVCEVIDDIQSYKDIRVKVVEFLKVYHFLGPISRVELAEQITKLRQAISPKKE